MKIEADTKQKIQSSFIFLVEFYKVLMGSFLILFVPQICEDHICTTNEILKNELECFILNIISCLYILYLYFIEINRENWCIKYLDIDPEKPNNNLDYEIEQYPEYKSNMVKINKDYKNNSIICIFIHGFNMIVSCIYISSHWAGQIALTPLLSYILLVCNKLYNTFFVSNSSISEERVYSAYLTISKTYNTIDSDYIINSSI